MIDMWFLLSLLKPFVDIITQTYIETLREDTAESMEIENIAWEDKDISTYKRYKYIIIGFMRQNSTIKRMFFKKTM